MKRRISETQKHLTTNLETSLKTKKKKKEKTKARKVVKDDIENLQLKSEQPNKLCQADNQVGDVEDGLKNPASVTDKAGENGSEVTTVVKSKKKKKKHQDAPAPVKQNEESTTVVPEVRQVVKDGEKTPTKKVKKKAKNSKKKQAVRQERKAKKVFESLLTKGADINDNLEKVETEETEKFTEDGKEGDDKTVVKKKRKKKKSKVEGEEVDSTPAEVDKTQSATKDLAISYLQAWKNDRENWNFKKARQIWLIKNMYDEEKVDDGNFTNLLEYLEGGKGAIRTRIVQEAQTIHDSVSNSEKNGESDSIKINRAKEILQMLSE